MTLKKKLYKKKEWELIKVKLSKLLMEFLITVNIF